MPQRLRDLGEFGLIDRIARMAGASAPRAGVVVGIGDDAAVLRPPAGEDLVVTTDTAIEGVHFRLDQETPRTAGRRALVANLSDLAAMGAHPLGFVLALALPRATPVSVPLRLVGGLLDVARRHGCPLVGGNVSRAGEISATITALGAVARGRALRRDRARPGDRIWLTGQVGVSALERARGWVRQAQEPRLKAGMALSRLPGIGACIDVSDGVASDLGQLCRASGVGAVLDPDRLPRRRGHEAACRRLDLDPRELLLAGGEDYELLFTLRGRGPAPAQLERRLGVPVAEVGRIVPGRGVRLEGGGDLRSPGWRHF
jgi:thiamine-monophosphate kinase